MNDPQEDYEDVVNRINRFEHLGQDHWPSKSTISKYQVWLDGMSARYDYDISIDYLYTALYELQALIYIAEGNDTQAALFLNEALDIGLVDGKFTSQTAEDWYQGQQESVETASDMVYESTTSKKRFSKRTRILFWSGVCILGLLVMLSGEISDSLTIGNANPTMVKLAQDANMTREGELIFLRTNPQLVDDAQMAQYCPDTQSSNDGFIEQGCFIPNQADPATGTIYIRQMSSDLYNLEVTTAAYEMLHPAYESLIEGSDGGAALNQSIETNRASLSDANMAAQVANFAKSEPNARDLELFSIIGTGYSGISSDLASYYAPYITDIIVDVNLNNQVTQLFQSDKAQLTSLSNTINTVEGNANSAYNDSISWANVGNQEEDDYNYGIYQQDIALENTDINQYNTLLDQYNVLVDEFNGQQFTPDQTQTH